MTCKHCEDACCDPTCQCDCHRPIKNTGIQAAWSIYDVQVQPFVVKVPLGFSAEDALLAAIEIIKANIQGMPIKVASRLDSFEVAAPGLSLGA